MSVSRLFEMLYILLERDRVTAAELSRRLEVSVRTVYRDAQSLCEAGVPLYAERGRDGAVYCLGSGQARPLREYIYEIRDAIDPALPLGIGELAYYPNQVMHLEADISALRADTGFAPRYSFREGIRETIRWAREEQLHE